MALDFLGALGGLAQGAGAVGSLASSLGGLFGKKQKVPGEATNALKLQYSLMQGLAGENSPEYAQMVKAEQDNSRSALLKAVNEIVRQNRRSMTRGPAGVLVNPDRRDEAIARSLMGVYENETDRAKAKAKQTALGILGQAGAVQQNAMGLGNYANNASNQNALGMASGFSAAGAGANRLLGGIQQLLGGGGGSDLGAGASSTSINDARGQERRSMRGGLY